MSQVEIINKDFRDCILPEGLVITDPPYNQNHSYNEYKDRINEKDYIELLSKIPTPCVIIHYPEETVNILPYAIKAKCNQIVSWVYNSNTGKQSRLISWWGCSPNFGLIRQEYKNLNDKRIKARIAQGKAGAKLYDWWNINQVKNVSREKVQFPCQIPEEIIRRIITLTAKEGDLIIDPFAGCYDVETEVLTKQGWKYFENLEADDEFLTVNETGEIQYQKSSHFYKYFYDGKMIKIKSRSTDLLVTPNHNMYVLTNNDFNKNKRARFVKSEDMSQSCYRIPCGGKFKSKSNYLNKEMMYLIGLYVSEGYFEKIRGKISNNLIICQNKGIKWNTMLNNLKSFDVVERSNRKFKVKLTNKQRDFILKNCGKGKYNKFLSSRILNNTNLKFLFNGMMLGDGHISNTTNKMCYYTSSKKLADSFQELCIKLGFETNNTKRQRGTMIIQGRICNTVPNYSINIRQSKNKLIKPKIHLSEEDYNNYVYCVTVPNHTLYIRRGGTTSWCGNSGTTLKVAKDLGFNAIGYEIDSSYCKIIKERLR